VALSSMPSIGLPVSQLKRVENDPQQTANGLKTRSHRDQAQANGRDRNHGEEMLAQSAAFLQQPHLNVARLQLAARPRITEDDLRTRLADLDARELALENELAGLREQEERLSGWREEQRQFRVWLDGLRPMLLDIVDLEKSLELQRELLLRAVDRVWVDRNGRVEIEGAINLSAPPKRPFRLTRVGLHRQPDVTSRPAKGGAP
jgi:hypothetical protein